MRLPGHTTSPRVPVSTVLLTPPGPFLSFLIMCKGSTEAAENLRAGFQQRLETWFFDHFYVLADMRDQFLKHALYVFTVRHRIGRMNRRSIHAAKRANGVPTAGAAALHDPKLDLTSLRQALAPSHCRAPVCPDP